MSSPEEGTELGQMLERVSQFALALAVGEAVRSQRAFVAAVRDRADRAAREHELETRRRLDEERVQIAQDVHDIVAHSIAAISTQASVGVHIAREEPTKAIEALDSIKTVSAQALHDLRYALKSLRDPSAAGPTGPTPSAHDLPALVQRARNSGLSVTLRMEGSPDLLSAALQVAIYRIVQEALTNVMRHAGGAQATVRIAVRAQEVEVDVTDDGRGVPTAASGSGSGSGLVGMRERASVMGGELDAGRRAGGGFRVRALLPIDREPS
jgi:signal transduction histidine kinase